MSRLIPCSSCRRHVKRSDAACPFCAAPTPSVTPTDPRARAAPPGTKRAALFAMGVSLVASACEPEPTTVPIYGAPNLGGNSGFAGDAAGGSPNLAGSGGGGAGAIAGSGNGGSSAGNGGSDVTDAGDAGNATPPPDGGDNGSDDGGPDAAP
jgi:hypothetical protein